MPYKDPERRKQAIRDAMRKARGSQESDVNPKIVNPNINDVNPKCEPMGDISVILPDPVEISGPDMRLFEELAGLKHRIKLAEQTIESLVEQIVSLKSEPKGESRSRSKGALDELPFSRAKQAAGKGY